MAFLRLEGMSRKFWCYVRPHTNAGADAVPVPTRAQVDLGFYLVGVSGRRLYLWLQQENTNIGISLRFALQEKAFTVHSMDFAIYDSTALWELKDHWPPKYYFLRGKTVLNTQFEMLLALLIKKLLFE